MVSGIMPCVDDDGACQVYMALWDLAGKQLRAPIRNTNFYEPALEGPQCGNAMPPLQSR